MAFEKLALSGRGRSHHGQLSQVSKRGAWAVSSIVGSSVGPTWCKQPGACTSSCPKSSVLLHFYHLFHSPTRGSEKALASPLTALGAGEAVSPVVWLSCELGLPPFLEQRGKHLSIEVGSTCCSHSSSKGELRVAGGKNYDLHLFPRC